MVLALAWAISVSACASADEMELLRSEIEQYIGDKDVRIGVAVIFNGRDSVSVRGNEAFPMLSVYKFPQALAIADLMQSGALSLSDSVFISSSEMKPDTWSPMRDKYGVSDVRLPFSELLAFTLQQSDNNACDVLFKIIGVPEFVEKYLREKGFGDIHVVSTEDEMHRDLTLCYANNSTPLAMARLLDRFCTSMRDSTEIYSYIGRMMEECATGTDRLARPLEGSGAKIGHKTGTGDRNAAGRIIGVNDCGYVFLPDGRRYVIAVFVSDASGDMADASQVIADISEIVYNFALKHIKP